MGIFGFRAVLYPDVIIHHARFQWAWTIQGHQRNDVVKAIWPQLFYQFLHAPRFQLEHGGGQAFFQQLVSRGVVPGDAVDVYRRVPDCLFLSLIICNVQSMMVKVRSPKKSNLTKPNGFHVILIELRNQVTAALFAVQGRKIGQFGWGNHHAACVLPSIPRRPFQRQGHVDQVLTSSSVSYCCLEFGAIFQGFVQRHPDFKGNQV